MGAGHGPGLPARDRLGIKPLYYTDTPTGLRFASTLPALLSAGGVDTDIDPVALQFYMTFHAVVPAPFTILKGVRKLPPATVMTIEPDGSAPPAGVLGGAVRAAPGRGGPCRRRSGRSGCWRAAGRDRAAHGGGRAGRRAAQRGAGLQPGRGAVSRGRKVGLKTFSIGFEAVGGEKGDEFEYSDLIARHFATDHHKIFIDAARRCRPFPT